MSLTTTVRTVGRGRAVPSGPLGGPGRPPGDGDGPGVQQSIAAGPDAAGITRRRASAPMASLLVAVLVVLIPGTFYALTPHRGPVGSELLVIYLVIVLSGARLSILVAGAQIRIFECVLWAFYYAFLGIAPLVQQVSQSWPTTTPDLAPGSVLGAGLITLVSAVALLSGSCVRPGRRRRPSRSGQFTSRVIRHRIAPWPRNRAPKPERSGVVGRRRMGTVFAIFLVAAGMYYSRLGLSNIFKSRQFTIGFKAEAYTLPTAGVVIWALATMPLLCLAIALILNWRRARPNLAGRVATVAIVLITLVVFNPFSNPRFVFGAGALGLLGALGAYATLTRYRAFVIGLLVGIVLIFPYLDFARYSREDLAPSKGGPLQALTSGDFDAFAQIANTWAYLHELGPTWGRQALGVLMFWVPRSMWANKPEDTGILLAHFRQYSFTNLSAPLPSEVMINFSWVGLVVICLLIGRGLLRLDLVVDRRLRIGSTGSILSYVLPFYMLILLRGSLLQAMALLMTVLASSWFLRFGVAAPVEAIAVRKGRAARAAFRRRRPPDRPARPAAHPIRFTRVEKPM